MEDRKYELGHEPIGKLLVKYSTPATIAMLVNALYNLVDTIFVGRGAGTMALAGLAVSFPIQMIVLAAGQTIGGGAASIISRALGAGDHRKAERTAGTSFVVMAFVGLLLSVLGLFFIEPLIIIFGGKGAIFPEAKAYLSIIFYGTVFFGLAVSSNNVVRSEGNAKTAMMTMIVSFFTNMILDPIFIFGFKMGIKGAALATIIAQFCSFLYLFIYFIRGKSMLKIRKKDLIVDFGILTEVVKIGSPSLIRVVGGSVLAVVLNNSLGHYGSEVYIAIVGVINRVMMFLFMPLFGVIQGLQPIVGFNYGAKKIDRVLKSLKAGSLVSSIICGVGFLVIFFFPEQVIRLFSNDAELITKAVPVIKIICLGIPLVGLQVVGASFYQFIGKAKAALLLTMSRQIFFCIPIMLILPRYIGLYGVVWSFPISDVLAFILTMIILLGTIGKMKKHIESNSIEMSGLQPVGE